MEEDNSQTINCTVNSCKFNETEKSKCGLNSIEVEPCYDCSDGEAEDESMCGSYETETETPEE